MIDVEICYNSEMKLKKGVWGTTSIPVVSLKAKEYDPNAKKAKGIQAKGKNLRATGNKGD